MVDIPRLIPHKFLSCLATWKTSLYQSMSCILLLSPSLLNLLLSRLPTFEVWTSLLKSTPRRKPPPRTLWRQSVFTRRWRSWQRKFTREASLCRHVCPHVHTYTNINIWQTVMTTKILNTKFISLEQSALVLLFWLIKCKVQCLTCVLWTHIHWNNH